MMRAGSIRTRASSQFLPTPLPPESSSSAVPRTSIMRGCHGGSTSSMTMLARPVRRTSRAFLVWLIRSPPTSMASWSGLYRNDVGTTCGCPSGPTVAIRPRRCPARYSSSLSVKTLMPRLTCGTATAFRPSRASPGLSRSGTKCDLRFSRPDKNHEETAMQKTRQHAKAGALALGAAAVGLVLGLTSAVGAIAGDQARTTTGGIPRGYAQVDPRNPARSQQVFLGQPLSDNAPIFPGDPPFKWQLWNCVKAHPSVPRCQHGSGYTLEQIQSRSEERRVGKECRSRWWPDH